MPGFLDDADACTCGHIKEEHDAIGICTIEGCACDAFDWDGIEDDEDLD